jgi:hypothetical protein
MLSRFTIVLFVFFFVSCSKEDGSKSNSTNIFAYSIVGSDSGFITKTSSEVSGSGQILFEAATDEISAGHNFAFQLSLDEGGSIVLHLFSNSSLASGVNITLTRSGANLACTIEINSNSMNCDSQTSQIVATFSFPFYVDVHNDEDPSHVLIWSGSAFSESDAIFNSEVDFPGLSSGDKAVGTVWGVTLTNATITKAKIGDPLFEEE